MINLVSSSRKLVLDRGKKNIKILSLIFENNINLKNSKSNYHWDDNKKLKNDLKKIYKIYYKFIKFLTERLNSVHKTNKPEKYWEILIWRWLTRYIIYYYDRWEIVSSLSKIYKKKSISLNFINFKEEKFIPYNTEDWCLRCVMSEDWDHWVYSEIFKSKKNFKFSYVNKFKIKPVPKFIFQKKIKNPISKLKFIYSPFLNKKIISQNLGFSRKTPIPLMLFLKKMHYIDDNLFSDFNFNFNSEIRNNLSQPTNLFKTPFEKFLISQLKYNFPTIFLENYKLAQNKINKSNLPSKPKLIITSLDDIFNEPFKFYVAKNVIAGSKLFHLQHGGSYGTSDDYPVEKIQIGLCDKFFSWGWSDNKKVIPGFCQKTIGIKIRQTKKTEGVIIPIFDWNLNPGDISGGRPRNLNDINLYIKNLNIFYSKLNPKIKKKSAFKFFDYSNCDYSNCKDLYPKYVLNNLMNKFKKKNFFHSSESTFHYLDKYKINVETVNSTGYLETLNLNLPTILIFDSQFCRIRRNVKKYFSLLEKSNILFKNPHSAANFINKNYDNIDNWWNSKRVQSAVKIFSNKFARSTDNPYTFLEKLKKYNSF